MGQQASEQNNEKEIDLIGLFYTILNHYKLIGIVTTIFTIIGITYVLIASPIYQADALIQVENKNTNPLLGKLSDMLVEGQSKSAKEFGIIKSRLVLGKTVEDLHLDIGIQQKKSFFRRLFSSPDAKLFIKQIVIPDSYVDQDFSLEFSKYRYTLKQNDRILLTGEIGKPSYSLTGIKIWIQKLSSDNDNIKFSIRKNNKLSVISDLNNRLDIQEKNKDSGILQLFFIDTDLVQAQQILYSISQNYLQQNLEYTTEQFRKSLSFIEQQLPKIQTQLEQSEIKLNTYRQQHESFDLSSEGKALLDSSVTIETQLNELKLKEIEIGKYFTTSHPEYVALSKQKLALQKQLARLTDKIQELPQSQQMIIGLQRDVKINNGIYEQLLNQQQELKIAQASTISNIRIIDHAVAPSIPIKPKKKLIVLVACLMGLIFSSGFVVLRQVMGNQIVSAEQIEDLGLQAYASVPQSDWQRQYIFNLGRKNSHPHNLLAHEKPDDLPIESLRSFRTALYFTLKESKNKIVLISSCTAGVGKSFISSNLAYICAKSDKKVLLIDADMRRGYLKDIFKGNINKGLSDYLARDIAIKDIIGTSAINPNLDIIKTGDYPKNPSELLLSNKLEQLLAKVKEDYDLIIIDTPPILSVTDATIIAKHVGSVFIVVNYAVNLTGELKEAVKRFIHNDIKINGVILNGVKQQRIHYQYGYYHSTDN